MAVAGFFYSHSHPDFALKLLVAAIGLSGVGILALIAYLEVYLLTARIYVDSVRLIHTAWLARRQEIRIADLGSIRRCSIAFRGDLQPAYMVENTRGWPIFCLFANRWGNPALETLWRRLGLIPSGSWNDQEESEMIADLPCW